MKNMRKVVFLLSFPLMVIITSCGDDNDFGVGPGPIDEEQLAADIITIDNFLNENGIDAEIHSSGIRYVVDQEGDGDVPALGDDVALKFTSAIMGGDVVGLDTIGFTINLSQQIIEAWRLMIPEMKENGRLTIYVPSGYAFGSSSITGIPANSILTYTIDLLERVDDADEQFVVDLEIIDELLAESNIVPREHSSAIRYVIHEQGNDLRPTSTDVVLVEYSGRFLDGTEFDATTNVPAIFDLTNLIESWRLILPLIGEGGRITFYSPSQYCYGPSGSGGVIPANTPLVFEIELVSIDLEE